MFSLPQRFWSRVRKTTTCWLWTGARHEFGHGRYWMNGRNHPAHRVIWESKNGATPRGSFICHKCDVPNCVNPAHLFVGSPAANMADKTAKGRQYRPIGDLHHNRKLSSKKVAEVRRRLAAGERGSDIALSMGVHRNTIYHIKAGRSWRESC